MPNPFPSPPGTNPPRHIANEGSGMAWMLLTVGVALLVALGIFVFMPRGEQVATMTPPPPPPPAVTAPAPIDETTGVAIPGRQPGTIPRIPDAPPPQ